MFTPDQIADYFLSQIDIDKGDTISPLKLQKLVYYAQAWHYTSFDTTLFDEKIEAWMNGPVIPSLYKRFAGTAKYSAIDLSQHEITPPNVEGNTAQLLGEVFTVYGNLAASYLEELTHQEPPWINARGTKLPHESCNNEITPQAMKEYYSTFNAKA